MTEFLSIASILLFILLVVTFILTNRRVLKLKRQIENINSEQGKLGFRLFVVEKKVKVIRDKKVS